MARILIVDDTRLYLEGLAEMLRSESRVNAVETAASPDAALHHLTSSCPDVVLLNTAMGNSALVLRKIAEVAGHLPVVALGVPESESDVITWAEAGVAGYLFKRESLAALIAVIDGVVRGETLCPPRITATLLRRVAALAAERRPQVDATRLTAREREILELVDQGLANKEIARRLSIEVRTVKNHVHNILEKLRVQRRSEAAAYMRRLQHPVAGARHTVRSGD